MRNHSLNVVKRGLEMTEAALKETTQHGGKPLFKSWPFDFWWSDVSMVVGYKDGPGARGCSFVDSL